MSLVLSRVDNFADFSAVAALQYEVFNGYPSGFWRIFRGRSLEEFTERQWQHFKSSPNARWVKVVDMTTNEIVGAGEWVVNETNPYEQPLPKIEATWWPEGPHKDIAEQMITTFLSERPKRMSRPHILLSLLFVSEKARRRGAGRMIMDYGCGIADELGLEAFVESTEMAIPLYKSVGFVVVGNVTLDAYKENPTPEWTAVHDEVLPQPDRPKIMWRPKGGRYMQGVTKFPWT